jgi:WhiB family redox-sensing transcriptional regulator
MDDTWKLQARCRGMDTNIFIAEIEPPRSAAFEVYAEALRVCHQCSVRAECLTDAVIMGEQLGVRGGSLHWDRSDLRRAWRKTGKVPI